MSFVQLLNNSMTEVEAVWYRCGSCGGEADQLHGRVTKLDRIPGEPLPELIVSVKRFDNSGHKLRTAFELPRSLFAVAGYNALYHIESVVVHIGHSAGYGHWIEYERVGPAAEDEAPAKPPKTASEEEKEGYKAQSFVTWTKYDDNVKTTGIPWSEVKVSFHYSGT